MNGNKGHNFIIILIGYEILYPLLDSLNLWLKGWFTTYFLDSIHYDLLPSVIKYFTQLQFQMSYCYRCPLKRTLADHFFRRVPYPENSIMNSVPLNYFAWATSLHFLHSNLLALDCLQNSYFNSALILLRDKSYTGAYTSLHLQSSFWNFYQQFGRWKKHYLCKVCRLQTVFLFFRRGVLILWCYSTCLSRKYLTVMILWRSFDDLLLSQRTELNQKKTDPHPHLLHHSRAKYPPILLA